MGHGNINILNPFALLCALYYTELHLKALKEAVKAQSLKRFKVKAN